MPSNRWVDRTQPQTLMMATVLMYVNAALDLLLSLGGLLGDRPAARRRPGRGRMGHRQREEVGLLAGPEPGHSAGGVHRPAFSFGSIVSLLFYGALVALLLHPQSRSYRRTWFR